MDLLKSAYPKRDYTRVIKSRPALEHHYPKAIRYFTQYISNHVESITEDERKKIESELKDFEGFLDVPKKEKEIDKRHGDIVESDKHLKNIAKALKNLASQEGYDLDQYDSPEKHHGENGKKG